MVVVQIDSPRSGHQVGPLSTAIFWKCILSGPFFTESSGTTAGTILKNNHVAGDDDKDPKP